MAGNNITGLREASEKLLALGNEKKAKKFAGSAGRKAMRIVLADAKANAIRNNDPESDRNISKNIVIRAGKTKVKGAVRIRIGVSKGTDFFTMYKNMIRIGPNGKPIKVVNPYYKIYAGQTPYWWFVELGTKHSMAVPFLRPALEQNIDKVEQMFAQDFMQQVEMEISRR